ACIECIAENCTPPFESCSGIPGETCDDGVCVPDDSCVGSCGDQAPSGCWCDDACEESGDCCADKEDACGDVTCESLGHVQGSCDSFSGSECQDNQPYDCQQVEGLDCWVQTEVCQPGQECVDPFGPEGASCVGEPTGTSAFSALEPFAFAEDDPLTADVDEGDCCFDYDGDGAADNALGSLFVSLGGFLNDESGIDGLIETAVESGTFAALLEQAGVDVASGDMSADDDEIEVSLLWGTRTDNQHHVAPSNFDAQTGLPLVHFTDGAIVDGLLSLGPVTPPVVPTSTDPLVAMLQGMADIQIEADVYRPAGQQALTLTNGRLGGLVHSQLLLNALNSVSDHCTCLGLDGAPMLEMVAEDKMACTTEMSDAFPACDDADDSLCIGVA
ncbi:MAG: hypothetical protein QF464_22305, partial [Myxococcota bacterium]|nr:hypothetical protein [Myxococcota bacterium]